MAAELEAIVAAHPGETLQLWFEDEAREGQKGRTGHRWFSRGKRPPGRYDKRFLSTYIFAAVRSGTDDGFALVLPEATAATCQSAPKKDPLSASKRDPSGWRRSGDAGVFVERGLWVSGPPERPSRVWRRRAAYPQRRQRQRFSKPIRRGS